MLIGHGDDVSENVTANFSSNVWYGANNDLLYAHLFQCLKDTRQYPEVIPGALTKCIAEYHHIPETNILVTNGATEAIYLMAQAFPRYVTNIVCPAFSEYEDACAMHKHRLNFTAEEELNENTIFCEELVFMGNPNNPTGKAYSLSFIEKLLRKNPNTLFVIDEAYADFTITNNSAINYVSEFTNLAIIKSLTKTFCIPGLRLGYVVSNDQVIGKLKECKMPWSINTLAITAGEYLFSHMNHYQIPLQEWHSETLWLMKEIDALNYFKALPSQTTYFLCQTQKADAGRLKDYLLSEHRLLIRDASNFRGLNKRYFRICTQSRNQNQLLIEALKQWTSTL